MRIITKIFIVGISSIVAWAGLAVFLYLCYFFTGQKWMIYPLARLAQAIFWLGGYRSPS